VARRRLSRRAGSPPHARRAPARLLDPEHHCGAHRGTPSPWRLLRSVEVPLRGGRIPLSQSAAPRAGGGADGVARRHSQRSIGIDWQVQERPTRRALPVAAGERRARLPGVVAASPGKDASRPRHQDRVRAQLLGPVARRPSAVRSVLAPVCLAVAAVWHRPDGGDSAGSGGWWPGSPGAALRDLIGRGAFARSGGTNESKPVVKPSSRGLTVLLIAVA